MTIRLTPSDGQVLHHLCRAGQTGTGGAVRARYDLPVRGLDTKAVARVVGRALDWVRPRRGRLPGIG